ncbi:hypothetical protein D3C72_1351630 [compost metagenome]
MRRAAARWARARVSTWPATWASRSPWKPTTSRSTCKATSSATRRSTAMKKTSTARTSGWTAATWCWCQPAPMATRPTAGTPLVACLKWAAIWGSPGMASANGRRRAARCSSAVATSPPCAAPASTCPVVRWTCRPAMSTRPISRAPTASCTTPPPPPAIFSTVACTVALKVPTRAGAAPTTTTTR